MRDHISLNKHKVIFDLEVDINEREKVTSDKWENKLILILFIYFFIE